MEGTKHLQLHITETIYKVTYFPNETLIMSHWSVSIVFCVSLALWEGEVITGSHLLIHRRCCAADAGPGGDEASGPGSLREGVRGAAEGRATPELCLQLRRLEGHTVDLHNNQVRGTSCSYIIKYSQHPKHEMVDMTTKSYSLPPADWLRSAHQIRWFLSFYIVLISHQKNVKCSFPGQFGFNSLFDVIKTGWNILIDSWQLPTRLV